MNSKKLIIYGNGSMAKMIYCFLRPEYNIVAFTVDRACIKETTLFNLPVVAFEDVETEFSPSGSQMITAIGYLRMNRLRADRYQQAKDKGYSFISYCHPSVVLHPEVTIGENSIILEHASIHPFSQIGDSVFVSSNTNIGHDCIIEDNCWINAGVSIAGETTIKANSFLGVNSSVGQRLTIGTCNLIGANTFVGKNTERDEVYVSSGGEKFRMNSEQFMTFSKM